MRAHTASDYAACILTNVNDYTAGRIDYETFDARAKALWGKVATRSRRFNDLVCKALNFDAAGV